MPLITFGDFEVEATARIDDDIVRVDETECSAYSVYLRTPPYPDGRRYAVWLADFADKVDAINFAIMKWERRDDHPDAAPLQRREG